jgi:hypothetical protein
MRAEARKAEEALKRAQWEKDREAKKALASPSGCSATGIACGRL